MIDEIKTGKAIKEQMKRNNFSRARLSQEIGVSPTTVSFWTGGRRVPTVDNFLIMRKLFHCSLDDLIIEKDNNGLEEPEICKSCIHKISKSDILQFKEDTLNDLWSLLTSRYDSVMDFNDVDEVMDSLRERYRGV